MARRRLLAPSPSDRLGQNDDTVVEKEMVAIPITKVIYVARHFKACELPNLSIWVLILLKDA